MIASKGRKLFTSLPAPIHSKQGRQFKTSLTFERRAACSRLVDEKD